MICVQKDMDPKEEFSNVKPTGSDGRAEAITNHPFPPSDS